MASALRLWPLLIGTAAGIWLNAGALTGPYARYTTIALGLLLAINAIIGLTKFNFIVAPRHEKWVGGIVGLITGMISAATGVQVIPSVPFLQAIGMEKEELIQALGVFFTVATLALGYADGFFRAAREQPGDKPLPARVVELGGREVPVVGRVTMDLTMVAVDGPVGVGEVATVYGGSVSLDQQAEAAGTISYELLTGLGARLPRRHAGL